MEKATRLFDCMATQAENPLPDLLNAKINGKWKAYSTREVHSMVNQLSAALLNMGVSSGDGTTEGRDKIALISAGRPEWLIIDLAVQQIGAVLVPLYPNSSAHELEEILNQAEVRYVFVSNQEIYDKVNEIHSHVPSLKTIFTLDAIVGAPQWTGLLKPLQEQDLHTIKAASNAVTEDDVTTIIYTSGTTGHPKGVMLTHKNILSNVKASSTVLNEIPVTEKRVLSFLPLNHIFEKVVTYIYLFSGFSVFYAESMDTIGANLREVKPSVFSAVPRVLEKVFEKIMTEGRKLTGIKHKIFFWAISVADQFELGDKGFWYNIKLAIANKLVFSKWRAAIGGNVKAIVVGSSACSVRLEKIFTAADIVILEGYGLTETSPVISVNHYPESKRRFGTVGPLIDDVQVMIAEDGEILCKGPNIMAGYYKNPGLTAEVMQGGWFHTGDVGMLDEDGFLKITDRKKEIFKTSGGKYVAPTPIENRMKENYFIEQMMVVGDGKKFAGALIVPSYTHLMPWCQKNEIACTSHDEMIHNKRVIAMYQSIIDDYNPEFNHVEQIKKIKLLPSEWSLNSGELTPTGKMKRKVITEKYNTQIESMYTDEVSESSNLVS